MIDTYEQRSKLKLTATVVAILIIAGIVILVDHLKLSQTNVAHNAAQATTTNTATPTTSSNASSATSAPNTTTTSTTTANASGYKDGAYNASVSYSVPRGQESIQVSLTLANGVVTGVSIHNSENDFDSAQYQEEFAADYKAQVVGKSISGLRVSVIAGASDTTQAFNTAVDKITSQAQA